MLAWFGAWEWVRDSGFVDQTLFEGTGFVSMIVFVELILCKMLIKHFWIAGTVDTFWYMNRQVQYVVSEMSYSPCHILNSSSALTSVFLYLIETDLPDWSVFTCTWVVHAYMCLYTGMHTHSCVCALNRKIQDLVGTQKQSSPFFSLFFRSIAVDQICFPMVVCAIK